MCEIVDRGWDLASLREHYEQVEGIIGALAPHAIVHAGDIGDLAVLDPHRRRGGPARRRGRGAVCLRALGPPALLQRVDTIRHHRRQRSAPCPALQAVALVAGQQRAARGQDVVDEEDPDRIAPHVRVPLERMLEMADSELVHRAKLESATVILGSATPSLVTGPTSVCGRVTGRTATVTIGPLANSSATAI